MRLNLGCGGDIRPDYINIDLFAGHPEIVKLDVESLPFQSGSIDEIHAQDILEHISHRKVLKVLRHWCDLLRRGGKLTLRVPDIEKQCQLLVSGYWSVPTFSHMMFGGQDSDGNYHKTGFTLPYLTTALHSMGMTVDTAERLHNDLHQDLARSSNPNLLVAATKL